MVLTPSAMIPLGTPAPDFTLQDVVSGNQVSLHDVQSDIATVVMFICNHCPYVKHIHSALLQLAREYKKEGINFVAISANDPKLYPEDAPEKMKETAEQYEYPFPYLFDETQEVAKAYRATCTPDFFIFDKDLQCIYRGRFDESTPGNELPVTGNDLRYALDHALRGETVPMEYQHPSMGCNIKWKDVT